VKRALLLLAACLVPMLCLAPVSLAAGGLEVSDNRAEVDFPGSITFHLEVSGQEVIDDVELEYGTMRTTCGSASAKARPDFDPATQVRVDWEWSFRKSNSPPPGARVWWCWHVRDKAGNELTVQEETIAFDDTRYDWQETSSEELLLFAATPDQTVNQALWQAANEALARLESDVGARPERPVRIYNYPSTEELREAVVYTHEWTGGLAFTAYDTILLGVNRSNLEWGKGAIAHELAHVVVHQLTFNCLGDIPTWLDEGLATYTEGNPRQEAFDEALAADDLFSLQSLCSGFPTNSERAHLAYAQSYQVVAYLIETYDRVKMAALLQVFRDGATYDKALEQVYGFDVLGLDSEWRVSLGLSPRQVVATPTATPMVTRVPYGAATATQTRAAPAARARTATATQTQTPRATSPPATTAATRTPAATATRTAKPTRRPTDTPSRTPAPTSVAPSAEHNRVPWLGWTIGFAVACALALAAGGVLVLRRPQRPSGRSKR
jgi:hypothetical protein